MHANILVSTGEGVDSTFVEPRTGPSLTASTISCLSAWLERAVRPTAVRLARPGHGGAADQ
jgi:hypothetical protein